jgi:hypothetical protein
MVHPTIADGLQKNRWNLPSAIGRNRSVVFEFFLPNSSGMSRTATNGHTDGCILQRAAMLKVSGLGTDTLSYPQA